MLAPETVLQSRYRVIRQLGQGGMGAVYEALDERLDTVVALKETLFTDERLRKQFEREARLLARMHHPALPRVSDHFSEVDGQFLVMQFIAGDDLFQMMASKRGPFPPDQVLTWGDQLLDALDYLHTQDPQIIHRDIKPQNLKLTSRGQIILLDFGLAKGQGGEVSRVGTTSASIFGYTPNYAPLEQIQGLGTDARSDIYALSATLYHLITGVKPPDALTRAAAIVNGQPDPLRPAHDINVAVGPQVSGVLARGMSQNRDQRYASAATMRDALKSSNEVATLTERAEAATVILQPSASTIADGAPTELKPKVSLPGETTVVRTTQTGGAKRFAPWAVAAAVLLIGVVFGGYYALQSNETASTPLPNANEQAAPSPAEPSPTEADPNPDTTADGETAEPVVTPGERVESVQALKKNESPARKTEKAAPKPSMSPSDNQSDMAGGSHPPDNTPDAPEVPDPETSQPVRPDLRRLRRLGGVTIRNFPDGTQVLTSPDGTRTVIFPNGTRRVFRPGQRIDRRRLP